jgi:aminobenzoyl-glutamate utilization protein B
VARSPTAPGLEAVWKRILKVADGAAMMTETTLEMNIRSSYANIIGNDPLSKVAQRNLEEVGGFLYTADEIKFAEEIQKTLPEEARGNLENPGKVSPLRPVDPNAPSASTDAGDVSWNVPTIGFGTATFVPGVGAHTWQGTACAGMSIGQRGMLVAAKAIAITVEDLFSDPKLVLAARADFELRMKGKVYASQIPVGAKAPLDYWAH